MSLIGNSKLVPGDHALFSPSTPAWTKYTDEQFIEALQNKYRAQLGTEIHEWASIQIQLGLKVSGVRDAAKSIRTMIFEKYYDEKYGLSSFGETLLHNLKCIQPGTYSTVKSYVNDSISYLMVPEERLEYSINFFGTCDAIAIDPKKVLHIFDLKTGVRPAKIEQLYAYAALYCLSNHTNPRDISMDLRIYQNCEVLMDQPDPSDIQQVMDTIVRFDSLMTKYNKGGAL